MNLFLRNDKSNESTLKKINEKNHIQENGLMIQIM